MMVMAITSVRHFDLVVPLANATDMRITETAGLDTRVKSGAVSPLIGESLRQGDVDSTIGRCTLPILVTPGIRISTTVTRTTTTLTTSVERVASAEQSDCHHADFSFAELVQAYLDCRKSKRNSASALAFEANLERNL